jgi:6-phosphogluconolactonase
MKDNIQIFQSVKDLADSFAESLIRDAGIIGANSFYSIALSGGSTPRAILQRIREKYMDDINWSKVIFFWGDERCVDPSSSESNFRMADESLFLGTAIPRFNIQRIEGEQDPIPEAKRYSDLLTRLVPGNNNIPRLDLVMLGLGEDGHTASVFPYNIHLFDSDKLFELSHHPESGQARITATGKVINNAKRVCFLVTGPSKSEKAAQVLQKKTGWQDLPASRVNPSDGELLWMLDSQAASQLNYHSAPRH